MRILCSILVAVITLASCSKSSGEPDQPASGKKFSSQQMQDAANYSEQKGGSGVVVMQDGKIIFENYHNGANANTATHIQSGTKGFFAAGIMLTRDGLRL